MTIEHPIAFASELAKLLEHDLVATGQIKEHITEERLIEILGIHPPMTESLDQALENCDRTDEDLDDDIIGEFRRRFPTKATQLAALK